MPYTKLTTPPEESGLAQTVPPRNTSTNHGRREAAFSLMRDKVTKFRKMDCTVVRTHNRNGTAIRSKPGKDIEIVI
jgi:hypothetical protein